MILGITKAERERALHAVRQHNQENNVIQKIKNVKLLGRSLGCKENRQAKLAVMT